MKIFPMRFSRIRGPQKDRDRPKGDRSHPGGIGGVLRSVPPQRAGIAVGTVVLILLLYVPLQSDKFSLPTEGQIVQEDILAPFDFRVLKDEGEFQREIAAEEAKVPPVVRVSDETTRDLMRQIEQFFVDVERILDTEGEAEDQHRMLRELGVPMSEAGRNVLLDLASEQRLREEVRSFFFDMLDRGVLSEKEYFLDGGYDRLSLIKQGEEYMVGIDNLLDLEHVSVEATEWGRTSFEDSRALLNAFFELATYFAAPNLTFDVQETEARRAERREAVPAHTDIYLKGQKIIGAHERVSGKHIQVLRSMEQKWAELRTESGPWQSFYPHAGRLLAAAAVVFLFAVYLRRHRPKLYRSDVRLLLISVIGLIGVGLTSLITAFGLSYYLIPVVLVAMLATILFDDHVGIAVTGAFLMVTSLIEGLSLPLIFTLGLVGATAVYGVAGLRERKRFWQSLFYVGGAYVISIGAADFLHLVTGEETLVKIGYGLLSAFGSAGLAMIVLPLFESLFKMTTNITLLELSDLNRPLLKNLSLLAPGTYHHSIMVGNLSEAAAEAIGANSLRARVGAYYHDIGKMAKPDYFVENQAGGENKHDRLSPKISALVLISHVREGTELARKERLPADIIDAIREHHGTTLMAFFYEKARSLSGEGEVPDSDFRYPGPKPKTRENAIIMLADVAEAATRALVDPTRGKIAQRIFEVTNAKFEEGQLDDCDLTFRELRKIQEAFVPILTSAMHSRIRYPDEIRREEARFAVGDLLRKPPKKV